MVPICEGHNCRWKGQRRAALYWQESLCGATDCPHPPATGYLSPHAKPTLWHAGRGNQTRQEVPGWA